MKENGNKIIPYNSSLLFSDGTKMGIYCNGSRKKTKIYEMIIEKENQFIMQYKDQYEVLIKEYNKKQLSEEERLLEYLHAMKENANKIIPPRSPLLFSDGTQMGRYWKVNKDKIYKMITKEGNLFVMQYKKQCEVIIKEYNNYQKNQEAKITEEEKLFEYLQAIKDNGNDIIPQSSPLLFSDGTKMGYYWNISKNKDKIYKMITEEGNLFIVQYKEQCEVIIKEYNNYQKNQEAKITEEEKLFEYLKAIKDNGNKIIPQSSPLLFSDGTKMGIYWNSRKKDKRYEMIIEKENQFIMQYKEQCEVLIKEYNKKGLGDEEKLLEYLKAMKENDNKIIPARSPLLFSDGTKMGYYWSDKKDKIYKMITAEGNLFVAQYKEQCEVLINEYVKFQEKKKKEQEKYKESESDFREESSFDKTLKNEKGKYSNEGKKVL